MDGTRLGVLLSPRVTLRELSPGLGQDARGISVFPAALRGVHAVTEGEAREEERQGARESLGSQNVGPWAASPSVLSPKKGGVELFSPQRGCETPSSSLLRAVRREGNIEVNIAESPPATWTAILGQRC